jgi:hypothetical protein
MRSIKHIAFLLLIFNCRAFSQITDTLKKPEPKKDKNALKFNLNDDGSHYFQATFLNQTWLRFNESNPGTTTFGKITPSTFDIGLRRTRKLTTVHLFIFNSVKITLITPLHLLQQLLQTEQTQPIFTVTESWLLSFMMLCAKLK